jgi:hypothetical protein
VTIILGDGPWYADFDRQEVVRCIDRAAVRPPRSNRPVDSLALVVLCTTVGIVQAGAPFAKTYCLSLAPLLPADTTFLLLHFRDSEPRLRPPSDCQRSPDTRGGFLVDQDGRPAVTVGIASLTVMGNSASSEASYHAAMLWALGWRCDYRRSRDGWHVEQCLLQWQS